MMWKASQFQSLEFRKYTFGYLLKPTCFFYDFATIWIHHCNYEQVDFWQDVLGVNSSEIRRAISEAPRDIL